MKIGYRSIGETEFYMLIKGENPIYGKQRWNNRKECGCTLPYGVVCFFLENIKWHDRNHLIDIKVRLNNYQEGIGEYLLSKEFAKTKEWTGRDGKTKYKIQEAYQRFYTPQDIIEIDIKSRYARWFIEKEIEPFCNKYNIKLIYQL